MKKHTKKTREASNKAGKRAKPLPKKTAKKKAEIHTAKRRKTKPALKLSKGASRDEIEAQVLEWREKARDGYVPVWTRSGTEFFRVGSEVSHGIFGDYVPLDKKETFSSLKAKYESRSWNGLK